MTADVVEYEVTRALEWLQGERIESRRLASVLILREMADNAATLFHHHVGVGVHCARVHFTSPLSPAAIPVPSWAPGWQRGTGGL